MERKRTIRGGLVCILANIIYYGLISTCLGLAIASVVFVIVYGLILAITDPIPMLVLMSIVAIVFGGIWGLTELGKWAENYKRNC